MNLFRARMALFFVVAALVVGCTSSSGGEDLQATVAALETQVVNQENIIKDLANQSNSQWELINYLATQLPHGGAGSLPNTGIITPTPFFPVEGSVVIDDGRCCVGGTAGESTDIAVKFDAHSVNGEVVEMRVLLGRVAASESDMDEVPWEPFVQEKVYSVEVATNWSTFWIHVQYRDEAGVLSPLYSDDIAVEGK